MGRLAYWKRLSAGGQYREARSGTEHPADLALQDPSYRDQPSSTPAPQATAPHSPGGAAPGAPDAPGHAALRTELGAAIRRLRKEGA